MDFAKRFDVPMFSQNESNNNPLFVESITEQVRNCITKCSAPNELYNQCMGYQKNDTLSLKYILSDPPPVNTGYLGFS